MIRKIFLSALAAAVLFVGLPTAAVGGAVFGSYSDISMPTGTAVVSAGTSKKAVARATFSKKSITVTAGVKQKLPIKWKNKKRAKLKYTVKDKCLLTVSKKGYVKGLHPGETSVTLKNKSGKKSTIKITINEPADMNQTVYLTYDDGPGATVTPRLLDVLKQNKVKATFFVIGSNAENNSAILKRAAKEGHTIGIHTYSHNYGQIYSSPQAYLNDFHQTEKVIKKITGKKPRYFRFPGGGNNKYMSPEFQHEVLHELHKEGYIEMDWNAATGDATGRPYGAGEMVNIGLDSRFGRGPVFILAHDEDSKTLTPDVAAGLINAYRSKGAVFKGLNEYYGPEYTLCKR